MKLLSLLALLLTVSYPLNGQSTSNDVSKQAEIKDQSRESMFNNGNANAVLTGGGAFYVSNPPPLYEVDLEKAYLNPEFQNLTIQLVDGKEYTLPGRIRLTDQRIEVRMEDGIYDLDNRMLKTVLTPEETTYIASFDPSGKIKGTHLYEVAFEGEDRKLLINRSAEWQDPPRQNMFDTSEPHKTLKSVERTYLISDGKVEEIHRMFDLLNALSLGRKSEEAKFVRQYKLKNNEEDYVRLLAFIQQKE